MPSGSEVLGHGAIRRQKALGVPCGLQPLHAICALARGPMRILTAVVEVATLPVFPPGQDLALRRAVALQLVGNDDPWHVLEPLEQLDIDRILRSLVPAQCCLAGFTQSRARLAVCVAERLTPIGKPPPLAVRLAEALPFRRAQGIEERRTLHVRQPAYSRGLPDTYPGRDGLWRGSMVRATFWRLSNGSRGFAGPSGPFPASLAPSGGLHQTTRSAGST